VRLELEDVPHVRGAEPVDGLVGVADHRDVAVLCGQQADDLVLGEVGVLVLVDEHVAKALPVVLEHVGARPEEPHGVGEQVVEVHRVGRSQALLVAGEQHRDPCAVGVCRAEAVGRERRGVLELGLGPRDGSLHARGGRRRRSSPSSTMRSVSTLRVSVSSYTVKPGW